VCKEQYKCSENFTNCEYSHSQKIKRGVGSEHYKTFKDKQAHGKWLERNKSFITKKVTLLSLNIKILR
jgi:hypothetical protein